MAEDHILGNHNNIWNRSQTDLWQPNIDLYDKFLKTEMWRSINKCKKKKSAVYPFGDIQKRQNTVQIQVVFNNTSTTQ